KALGRAPAARSDVPAPAVSRKDLARALLQAGRPAEARQQLEIVLRAGTDDEASWLLSRAFLQEGARARALAAWEAPGSFRDYNPLAPEPAPYVGSKRCAECHSDIYQSQHRSRHARTFPLVTELGPISLPAPGFSDPGQPSVTHTLTRRKDGRVQQETTV